MPVVRLIEITQRNQYWNIYLPWNELAKELAHAGSSLFELSTLGIQSMTYQAKRSLCDCESVFRFNDARFLQIQHVLPN